MAKLETLLSLWQSEGFTVEKLKEEIDTKRKDLKWLLFRLVSPEFYDDYGRHGVLQVLIRDNGEIVNHDVFNVSERMGENPQDIPCVGERDWVKMA